MNLDWNRAGIKLDFRPLYTLYKAKKRLGRTRNAIRGSNKHWGQADSRLFGFNRRPGGSNAATGPWRLLLFPLGSHQLHHLTTASRLHVTGSRGYYYWT